ncbi:EpsI family protein [Oryzomonas japonica]|uniref:EpsI family protein n=1 Tax=Oryzomonas japonica TaxID=2603858 RepID=A0A7J4ZTG4_9BACT|nr:exosortase C-terminal domain/associated protein EpsI [Oryzomonas japonica]KAB0666507.1 EpsI family protein [Oryzomonas japonica]
MRAVRPVRLAILIILLAGTTFVIKDHFKAGAANITKEPLQQGISPVGTWQLISNFSMDPPIVEALRLDDYLYHSYRRDKGLVNLYIGYYRTVKKVGAAHDPLVCFQGQGWQIGNRGNGEYVLKNKQKLTIQYSYMIAEHQGDRELVVYWFQANGKAVHSTQSQKVAMVLDKFSGRSEDNAFVRINSPLGEENIETVRKRVFDFIEDFYPVFYSYITRS